MQTKLISLIFLVALLTGCANPATVMPAIEESASVNSPISRSINSGFTLTSTDVTDGGRLPVEYTCDGDGSTLPLAWSGAPAETRGYAIIMHHSAAPEDIHWYWVLYNIPTDVTSLPRNVRGIGTLGNNFSNGLVEYSPPCSKGPGDKEYIYTVYALSAQPQITVPAEEVNRDVLLDAIKDITLASAELHTIYARQGMQDPQAQPGQSASNQQQGGRTPPPEAFTACNAQAENASCTFNDQNGAHTGECKTQQDTLVCAPDRIMQIGQQGQGTN